MRHLLILFLVLSLGFFSSPAPAQTEDASVYEVTDVAADVTADSAAHAREQALAQAQRSAFGQLLERLGVDGTSFATLSDDDIAEMVQSFEVQNEKSSSVRYLGTFRVQFKPNAVRGVLNNKNVGYTETRGQLVAVLPVLINQGRPVLWEESTAWRAAWDAGAHNGGLVPIVIPAGGLDDIAVISTPEAISGKAESLQSLMGKYQAGGALVAVLDGDPGKPGSELKINLQRYDSNGSPLPTAILSVTVPADKNGSDTALKQAVRQARLQLEKDWKEGAKGDEKAVVIQAPEPAASPSTRTTHLPVVVPIQTLAEWAQIKRRLTSVPSIIRTEVITLMRGITRIEIEFRGTVEELEDALMQQDLSLNQDGANGSWVLQAFEPDAPL
ncbi:MAG: DUF2066 domain-containing protein [Alphaproteobacteria bacterium]|nr:DUF2066 domain-containing protein [Alphaproteobacteria bacterium]